MFSANEFQASIELGRMNFEIVVILSREGQVSSCEQFCLDTGTVWFGWELQGRMLPHL